MAAVRWVDKLSLGTPFPSKRQETYLGTFFSLLRQFLAQAVFDLCGKGWPWTSVAPVFMSQVLGLCALWDQTQAFMHVGKPSTERGTSPIWTFFYRPENRDICTEEHGNSKICTFSLLLSGKFKFCFETFLLVLLNSSNCILINFGIKIYEVFLL